MIDRYHHNLSSILNQSLDVLELQRDTDGNYSWVRKRERWGAVLQDTYRNNIFSSIGIGARGATITIRPDRELTLHNAFRWKGQFYFLTSIVLGQNRDRQEIKAALCDPITLTAKPQAKIGRNELNRPTVSATASYTFPGIITELYRGNVPDEVLRVEMVQRALVTPKEILFRKGDIVQHPSGPTYTVRQVLDLDPWKNEYVIEAQEDA